jgi:hypothetical protein
MIDDTTILMVFGTMFAALIGLQYATYDRINSLADRLDKMRTVVKIICREHVKNHGGEMIDDDI